MKKLSNKRGWLLAAAMAVCVVAVPSMASAAAWSPFGSEHTLDSANFGASRSASTLGCRVVQFTADVSSIGAVLTITTAIFRDCNAHGAVIGPCTATVAATGLPWRATPVSATNIQIHDISIDVRYENPPGGPFCNINGVTESLTGTVTGGTFNNASHSLTLASAPGLTSVSPTLGHGVVTANGTIVDTQGTLVVVP